MVKKNLYIFSVIRSAPFLGADLFLYGSRDVWTELIIFYKNNFNVVLDIYI